MADESATQREEFAKIHGLAPGNVDEKFEEIHGMSIEEAEARRQDHEQRTVNAPHEIAYEAGRFAGHDAHALEHGTAACPFPPDTDERRHWLKGFLEVLERQTPVDLDALRKEVGNES